MNAVQAGMALLSAGAILSAGACLSLSKTYPEKRSFVLDVAPEPRESDPQAMQVLKIRRLRVSPLFAGRPMVYRVADLQYENDFYNEWLVAPGSLLAEQFQGWLAKCGRFRLVVSAADSAEPTHVLEARVTEFYGDYRNGAAAAVFGVEVRLSDEAKDGQALFNRLYHKEVPLPDRTPEALAAGLSSAVRQTLLDLDRDILEAAPKPAVVSGVQLPAAAPSDSR